MYWHFNFQVKLQQPQLETGWQASQDWSEDEARVDWTFKDGDWNWLGKAIKPESCGRKHSRYGAGTGWKTRGRWGWFGMKIKRMKDGDRVKEKGGEKWNCLSKYVESRRVCREYEVIRWPGGWELGWGIGVRDTELECKGWLEVWWVREERRIWRRTGRENWVWEEIRGSRSQASVVDKWS